MSEWWMDPAGDAVGWARDLEEEMLVEEEMLAVDGAECWGEPAPEHWQAAMRDLGLKEADLEWIPDEATGDVLVGDYPIRDQVYTRAWELQDANQQ
jgi:hypothetical protein